MRFRNIPLQMDWSEGDGFDAAYAPRVPGLYAQIYWPDRAVRIGQSASIRNRLMEATR